MGKESGQGLGIAPDEFKNQFLTADEESGKHVFKEIPCLLLKDNKCSIYSHRPKDCRSYQHLHKNDFVTRLWGVVENCSICPIAFNVYEQLKSELWHNDDEDDFFDEFVVGD
jgi:Fe-S-cluster containining protein